MESGKIHGIVGLNGAGKTTLLNTLYGFIRPVEGSILYNDNPLHRRDIAYLEAENYFYPYMTGHEYLDLFPAGENGFQVDNWQKLFNIPLNAALRHAKDLRSLFLPNAPPVDQLIVQR